MKLLRKTTSGLMLTLVLIGVLTLTFNIRPVKAWTGTVTIRADGSIDPLDAPMERNGDLYTLTGNITSIGNGIVVLRNNIIVEGGSYTVDGTGTADYRGVFLWERRNVTIRNVRIKTFLVGIDLYHSYNSTIIENNIINNSWGVHGWQSYNNSISGNLITASRGHSIGLDNCYYTSISENTIISNIGPGISLMDYSGFNTIIGNDIKNNSYGIFLSESSRNDMVGNDITENRLYGIRIGSSSNNNVYHNNLKDNAQQLGIAPGYTNFWDNGYPSGGNYWSDYTGVDANGDGIGDTPYVIDVDNRDRYPLMKSWTSTPPDLPKFATLQSMPDFGQHSMQWCWVAAAANCFYWLKHYGGFPNLYPDSWDEIDSESEDPSNGDWYCPCDNGYDILLKEICKDGDAVHEETLDFFPGRFFLDPWTSYVDLYVECLEKFIADQGFDDKLEVYTYSNPTFDDYKREIAAGSCVIILYQWGEPQDIHLVTGVSYNTAKNPPEVEVSDPGTPLQPNGDVDHNNDPNLKVYDKWEVTSEDPFETNAGKIHRLFCISPHPRVLSAWAATTPIIDGVLTLGEWDDAAKASFTLVSQSLESHRATLYEKNDAQYLYLAVAVLGDDFNSSDGVFFYFDNAHDGGLGGGDDWIYVLAGATGQGLAVDGYYNASDETLHSDTTHGGTNDILGGSSHTNVSGTGNYIFELRHPLDSEDDTHDFSLKLGDTVGVRMEFDDAFPGGAYSSPWPGWCEFADIIIASPFPPPENQPPAADAGLDLSVFSGASVLFNGSDSYDPDGTIVSYRWDFGDDTIAEGKIVSYRFRGAQNEPKTYSVTLTVEDDKGAKDTDTVYVTVSPLEKTVEVSYLPPVPILGQQVFGKMTVTYNWIQDTDYVVSKIHYKSEGFLGFGDISIWDTHSHVVPTPRWAAAIPSFGKTEKTYSPKLDEVQYGGDTFEGICIEAFDAMNIYIIGWAGISFSIGIPPTPFFKTASACFEPDSTTVPDLPIDEPDLNLAHLGSPGELRVYDSQGLVTGTVNGEVKKEISSSVYSNNTVVILSPSGLYHYEVAGTGEGSYGLVVASFVHEKSNGFFAADIPTSANAIHRYTIDWGALAQGEKGVTVQIDSDGDGNFEKTFTSDMELTRDEFMLQVPQAEAFPMWIVGAAIATVAIATAAIAVFWRKRSQSSIKR